MNQEKVEGPPTQSKRGRGGRGRGRGRGMGRGQGKSSIEDHTPVETVVTDNPSSISAENHPAASGSTRGGRGRGGRGRRGAKNLAPEKDIPEPQQPEITSSRRGRSRLQANSSTTIPSTITLAAPSKVQKPPLTTSDSETKTAKPLKAKKSGPIISSSVKLTLGQAPAAFGDVEDIFNDKIVGDEGGGTIHYNIDVRRKFIPGKSQYLFHFINRFPHTACIIDNI
jgi:hypothetical protein